MEGISLNYVTLIASVVNLFLGLLVLQENPKERLNKLFFIFTAALAAWAFINFYFIQYDPNIVLFRAAYSLGGFSLVLALPWTLVLVEKKISPQLVSYIYALAFVVAAIPFIGGQVIVEIINKGDSFAFVSGPLFDLYGVLLGVLLFYLLYLLTGEYVSSSGSKKVQLGYTLAGISIFAAVSFAFGVVLPLFGVKSIVAFDAQSSLFWVALTSYAITKHGLFNVKVIATQAFVGVLLLLIFSRILDARTFFDVVFETVVLLLTTIVSFFLIRSVKDEVKRREEVETLAREKTETLNQLEQRNKNLRALQQISDIVLNEQEMKPMAQKILDVLPVQLDSCLGAFLSIVRNGQLVAFSISSTQFSEKIYQYVNKDLESYSFPIKKGFSKLHDAVIEKKEIDSDNLSDFISPPIPKAAAFAIQKIIGAKHIEAIPLYAGHEPFGVLLFVFNASKERIHEKNFEIAKAIADEMSLAIQRAQAFQKLKDANEYLAELDKMKDEFISMASHELNTPLAAIEGYLSMILDEGMGKVDAKSRVYLSRAYESSKRLAELILDLLNVSRIEQGRLKLKFSQVSLIDLAQSVIHELQIKSDAKKIYLKLDADKKKVPLTWCDPDRIREVFVNLAGNAIKFTEKGGITIKIEPSEGNFIRASVIDTGRGISEEDQKKLFQKFSQVKREVDEHQGTGLGLYISKNFVELHKGKLWVESEEGKGATFIFEVPVTKEPPKELEGAILEQPINAPTIEKGSKDIPAIITESTKVSM